MTLSLTTKDLRHPATFSEKEQHILRSVRKLFSRSGTHGMSMRTLASELGISPSVLYHYFENQDALLLQMYRFTNYEVGVLRSALPLQKTAHKQFAQLIQFQFDQAESIVAVLKFYLVFRESFAETADKTLPKEATKHIEEVLQLGIDQGVYKADCLKDAKIIAHSVNGYLLEHFPYSLTTAERKQLIDQMVHFFEQPCLVSAVSTSKEERTKYKKKG
jgi:AcrR family transcriptional regulator